MWGWATAAIGNGVAIVAESEELPRVNIACVLHDLGYDTTEMRSVYSRSNPVGFIIASDSIERTVDDLALKTPGV